MQVLVIEPDTTACLLIGRALARRGHSMKAADDGMAALALLRREAYPLVLTSEDLPDMDGLEFCVRLQALPHAADTLLWVLSTRGDPRELADLLEAGASDYLLRPLDPGLLDVRLCIAERQAEERQKLRRAEQARQFASRVLGAVEQGGDPIIISSQEGRIEYVNQAFERVTGYSRAEALGRTSARLFASHGSGPEQYRALVDAVQGGHEWRGPVVVRRRDGSLATQDTTISPVRDSAGEVTHFVGILHDMTARQETEAARKQSENRLRQLAYHDVLTHLPNRLLLQDRLSFTLNRARRHGGRVALLLIDLDRFKHINETLGHASGDRLLQMVAQRLTRCLRDTDTIARIGGDEFVVVLPDVERPEDAAAVARKIMDTLSRPFVLEFGEFYITASVGISLYPNDGDTTESLLQQADAAMYHAKDSGRNTYQFYAAEMHAAAFERLALEAALRRALEREEFRLHYQPRIDLRTGRLVGAEALLRWQHPEDGLIPPGRFIRLAEDTGLIIPIGDWVMREACRQVRIWNSRGIHGLCMAVNLSWRQFRAHDLVDRVVRTLEETGLDARHLELEITESCAMHDVDKSLRMLRELKSRGLRIAIDDFGTGYSSLSSLKQLPIDALKIDQAFVRDIGASSKDSALVEAIIAMGHSLKLEVVAEGVETGDQLEFLRDHGCDEVQGYFIARPLPVEEFERRFLLDELRVAAG